MIVNKKKIAFVLSFLIMIIALTGCGEKEVNYADVPEEYVKTLEYHDGFVIVQLTDIHWNTATYIGNDEHGSKAYLLRVLNEINSKFGNVDLIEVTGDTFCLSNKLSVNSFIDFMEQVGVPYAITWGNHDRQCKFNPNWLSRRFLEAPFSLYTEVDHDNLHERGNYVVELMHGDKVAWQLFNLDSGSTYRSGAMDIGLQSDFIRTDQLEWLEFMHNRVGENVPVLCFYHIPQREFAEGYEAVMAGEAGYSSDFYLMEDLYGSDHAISMNPVFSRNNVKGAFVGHDHANDWTFTNPDNIVYGFGVKSNKELYSLDVKNELLDSYDEVNPDVDSEFDLMGASVIKLVNENGDFELYHLYLGEDAEKTTAEPIWDRYR